MIGLLVGLVAAAYGVVCMLVGIWIGRSAERHRQRDRGRMIYG